VTKKDRKRDVAKSTESRDENVERINQPSAKIRRNDQVDAIVNLAAKFDADDGTAHALSLVTAAVAVTATECALRATTASYLEERELELTLLNTLANTSAKLSRAWDAHVHRNQNEVKVRDVNVAPGAQAIVGVVGSPLGASAPATSTEASQAQTANTPGKRRTRPR